jgi:glutamate N-acetyltransferase / amino-acid N-acetyltransferase
MTDWPRGFGAHVASIGIKDADDDFVVVASDHPAAAAAVFTRSRFAGPSVTLSRDHAADGVLQAFVVVARNANVATGAQGARDAAEVVDAVARALGADPADVLIASTGVIGRPYPMDRVRAHLDTLGPAPSRLAVTTVEPAARAIMTTDTVPKVASATVGPASIVGLAKGVGMIEPDMATLIALFCTDAALAAPELDAIFRRVIDRTLNAVSIDTDTSTSDTAAVMANGLAGPVDGAAFEAALADVALSLTRQIARDGEGATTLIEVRVTGARDDAQAKRVGKAIVNSPLVKTAVHGADPNWGRVAMAIGKCQDDTDIEPERVVIAFGDAQVYPHLLDDDALAGLSSYLAGDEVVVAVDLGIGAGAFTVYGCDLTDGYVRINADYTT